MLATKNLFMFATILVYLVGAFAAPIKNYDLELNLNSHVKRGPLTKWCGGFTLSKPDFNQVDTVKINSKVKVMWEKGGSDVDRIDNLELMQEGVGLETVYWHGNLAFDSAGKASRVIKFTLPPSADKSKPFILRSWGSTKKGPACTVYSQFFRLVGK